MIYFLFVLFLLYLNKILWNVHVSVYKVTLHSPFPPQNPDLQ